MKTFFSFVIGFIVGLIVAVAFLVDVEDKPNDELRGLTMFAEKGECITTQKIEVFQVLRLNMALARTGDVFDGIIVLLINDEGDTYYDEQKIKIPVNKCARQVGLYQYTTKDNFKKTVPVVIIE